MKTVFAICILAFSLSMFCQEKKRVKVYGTLYENTSKQQRVDSIRNQLKQKTDSSMQKNDTIITKKPIKLL